MPPKISQVVFILNLNNKIAAIIPIAIDNRSEKAACASWIKTASIKPREAAFKPSKNKPVFCELRRRGISGLDIATNTKDGRKIPRVANIAPGIPPVMYPMKVAVVNTGPGVN